LRKVLFLLVADTSKIFSINFHDRRNSLPTIPSGRVKMAVREETRRTEERYMPSSSCPAPDGRGVWESKFDGTMVLWRELVKKGTHIQYMGDGYFDWRAMGL
jgi:hypothetical protein